MKRYTLFLTSLAFVAAAQLVPAGAATETLTVPLAAENGSGETGTATLTQGPDGVTVVISLKVRPRPRRSRLISTTEPAAPV